MKQRVNVKKTLKCGQEEMFWERERGCNKCNTLHVLNIINVINYS
jgi:hypothetical protein